MACAAAAEKFSPEITLRPFSLTESDVDDLMTWASDPRVTRFKRRHFTRRDEAVRFIADHILPHPWYRAICPAGSGGRAVGSISVKPAGDDHTCRGSRFKASVGYRLAYDHWGKGIATAALKAAVSAVVEEWPELERVEAVADVENRASQRVLEKAGFRREGVLRKYVMIKGETRDVVMYSFLPATHAILPPTTQAGCKNLDKMDS